MTFTKSVGGSPEHRHRHVRLGLRVGAITGVGQEDSRYLSGGSPAKAWTSAP